MTLPPRPFLPMAEPHAACSVASSASTVAALWRFSADSSSSLIQRGRTRSQRSRSRSLPSRLVDRWLECTDLKSQIKLDPICLSFNMIRDIFFRRSACSLSYLLASDIIETMQSVVSSMSTVMEKQLGGNGKIINAECSQKILPFLRRRLGELANKLSHDLSSCKDGGYTLQNKGDILHKLFRMYLQNSESTSDLLGQLTGSVLPQVPSCKTNVPQEMHHEFQTPSPNMFLTWYRSLHEENHGALAKMVKEVIPKTKAKSNEEAVKGVLEELHKLINVLVSLVKMCREHDKVAVHAMAVKYGGRFVDTFLKAFGFLNSHFEENSKKIIEMVKELQKATRVIQTICSEAKGSKRTMITSKIPATKKSLERLLFEVKALLHNTTEGTFELGVLKHKDLSGQVVSSQVYGYGDDDNDDDHDHDANDDHLGLNAIDEEDNMEIDQDANGNNSNQGDHSEACED